MNNFLEMLGIDLPIIQAPMAGYDSPELAAAVSAAGGLGSLACALLTPDQMRRSVQQFHDRTDKPINLNFFCHAMPQPEVDRESLWKHMLQPYYNEFGINMDTVADVPLRAPFDAAICNTVVELKPEIASFHFGLPDERLLARLKLLGIKILSSATTVEEAKWLEAHGCDAIIAQGIEAGGHRAMFLHNDLHTQIGTMSLVPQIVDAVSIPVIAAGGIADARGIAAAFALGASAVQLGTAYLFCPEAKVSPLYHEALKNLKTDGTAITNVFSGRPARGIVNRLVREIGPMSNAVLPFPLAARLIAPLRVASEKTGSTEFMQMWAGQAAALAQEMSAGELTVALAREALVLCGLAEYN